MKNILYKTLLITIIASNANIFGMHNLKKIITRPVIQRQMATNIKKHSQLQTEFNKKFKDKFPQLCTKDAFNKFLISYPIYANKFTQLVMQHLDKIHYRNLYMILEDNHNSEDLVIKEFKNQFSQLCSENIFYRLLNYKTHYSKEFTQLAIQHLDKIDKNALIVILKNDSNAVDLVIKEFREKFPQLCSKPIFYYFLDNNQQYAKEFITLALQHLDKINQDALKIILGTDSDNPNLFAQEFKKKFSQLCSIDTFYYFLKYNQQYAKEFIDLALEHLDKINNKALRIILNSDSNNPDLFAQEFKNKFSQLCSIDTFYYFLSNNKRYSKEFATLSLKHRDKINKKALRIILDSLKDDVENELIICILESEDLKKIKPTVASLIQNLPDLDLPSFIIEKLINNKAPSGTLTKQHMLTNLIAVNSMLTQDSFASKEKLKDQKVKDFLLNIYAKEKDEFQKGNYIFYHGRNKNIRFGSEIYHQLWKLKNSSKLTQTQKCEVDNFIFTRFEPKEKAINHRGDYFFMNHSLFSNAHETSGASTLTGYWLRDHSAHFTPSESFSIKDLFSSSEFNLSKYYEKYETDLNELQKLHNNASEHGDIIAVSIKKNKLHLVIPCAPGGNPIKVNVNGILTTDAKAILAALSYDASDVKLENGKSADYLEWKIPLEDDYALNPINGPRFCSFYFMDEKSQKEYEDFRDQIFAKIKQDIENDNSSK